MRVNACLLAAAPFAAVLLFLHISPAPCGSSASQTVTVVSAAPTTTTTTTTLTNQMFLNSQNKPCGVNVLMIFKVCIRKDYE